MQTQRHFYSSDSWGKILYYQMNLYIFVMNNSVSFEQFAIEQYVITMYWNYNDLYKKM